MVMSKINTFMSDGAVNKDAESPELERGAWPVVAGKRRGRSATILARERGISLRQAYRYLQGARGVGRAIPVGEPSAAATFKIPRDVLTQLRAYSRRSGLPLSAIVTEAIEKRLTATRRRGRHG